LALSQHAALFYPALGKVTVGWDQLREKVVLIYDLIATGGTAEASVALIEQLGGEVVECCFVIELPDIGGRKRLETKGYKVFALCGFEGE